MFVCLLKIVWGFFISYQRLPNSVRWGAPALWTLLKTRDRDTVTAEQPRGVNKRPSAASYTKGQTCMTVFWFRAIAGRPWWPWFLRRRCCGESRKQADSLAAPVVLWQDWLALNGDRLQAEFRLLPDLCEYWPSIVLKQDCCFLGKLLAGISISRGVQRALCRVRRGRRAATWGLGILLFFWAVEALDCEKPYWCVRHICEFL